MVERVITTIPGAQSKPPRTRQDERAALFADVPDSRRRTMSAIRGQHTKPEVLVRSMLHREGYRFRLHRRDLPGTPDVALPGRRKVIDVRGCFWHQHQGCPKCTIPKTRRDYWEAKLARNRQRDRVNDLALREIGWQSLIVWECELRDPQAALRRMREFLGPPGGTARRSPVHAACEAEADR